jgi:hypothetical protein
MGSKRTRVISLHSPPSESSDNFGTVVSFLFWLAWTSAVVFADVMLLYGASEQLRSLSFQPVTATLLESRVEIKRNDEGTSYAPVVRFRYEVAGRIYESSRLHLGAAAPLARTEADFLLPAVPLGGPVPAFYNPAQPAEAVLNRGVTAADGVWLLVLSPFHVVSIVGALQVVNFLVRCWLGREWLGMQVREDGRSWRVRWFDYSPWLVAVAALGGAGFVMMFAMAFIPSPWVSMHVKALVAWVVAIGVAGYYVRWAFQRSVLLTYDDSPRQFTYVRQSTGVGHEWPAGFSPCCEVREDETIDGDGESHVVYTLALVAIPEERLPLGAYMRSSGAFRMAKWLETRGIRLTTDDA